MRERMVKAVISMVVIGIAGGCAPAPPVGERAADLAFLPERFERGRVFRMYLPGAKSIRAKNWTAPYDFSGVSWNDKRTVTAISPRHVVMAAHFSRHLSTPVVFHDRDGMPHTRRLVGITPLRQLGDIAIGTLDVPLPESIGHYPLAGPNDGIYKRLVLVTDQTQTISLHRIGPVQGRRVQLGYDPEIDRRYWRNLVFGDSGNPAFIVKNGRLHLLTTFTTGGPGSGPFYGHPEIRARVGAMISE